MTLRLCLLINDVLSITDLCEYLEDALLKLKSGPFWLYIPDIDWKVVRKHLGRSSLYDHLAPQDDEVQTKADTQHMPTLLRSIVMKYIDIDPEDFFTSAPLSSYGLDSITAAQLSFDLQPFLHITQLQLLADATFDDLLVRADEHAEQTALGKEISGSELNESGETIVKLREGDGIPLILVHGALGDIEALKPLQSLFITPLWAIQLTHKVSFQSFPELAQFYYEEIKKARPDGPYRIGGYSGSSVITYELAHILESNGDEIKQLVMIDHFPTLFYSPLFQIDEETVRSGRPSHKLVSQVAALICDLYRGSKNHALRKVADELAEMTEIMRGGEDIPNSGSPSYLVTLENLTAMTAKFVIDLAGGEMRAIPEAIRAWVRQVRAPVSLYLASEGISKLITEDGEEWETLGASHCLDNVNVITITGTHLGILETIRLVGDLEKNW